MRSTRSSLGGWIVNFHFSGPPGDEPGKLGPIMAVRNGATNHEARRCAVDLWDCSLGEVPSGSLLHNYGKIHYFEMGQLIISMVIFSSYVLPIIINYPFSIAMLLCLITRGYVSWTCWGGSVLIQPTPGLFSLFEDWNQWTTYRSDHDCHIQRPSLSVCCLHLAIDLKMS